MSVLAIDTSGERASAAVTGKDGRIFEKMNDDQLDHLKSLIGLVDSVMKEGGVEKEDLEYIAVSAGPGSFTGIRIGMAAARTLAQVFGLRVAPVMTLDACKYNDLEIEGKYILCPMIDARRKNVFACAFEMPAGRKILREDLYSLEELIRRLPDPDRLVFTGSGAAVYAQEIRELTGGWAGRGTEKEPAPVLIDSSSHHAASVLKCALAEGRLVDYDAADPVYLRKAEAEVKRAEGRLGLRARKKKAEEEKKMLEMPPADEQITYRRLSAEDIPELAGLDSRCFGNPWSEEAFRGDLNGPRKAVYEGAFNSKGEMIGFAGAVWILDEGEINRVAVHPLYRTRGIGGACLTRVLKELQKEKLDRILLEVREANRSAITLYKNSGFRVISKRKNYYQDTGENALIMQLTGKEPEK